METWLARIFAALYIVFGQLHNEFYERSKIPLCQPRGKRVSESNNGLYFDSRADNYNELFSLNTATQMFKSLSVQEAV